jgi:hypothetical protein
LSAQRPVLPPVVAPIDSTDPVALMVARLDLEQYKTTLKGLTQFGDRKQGTKRNRDAVDWIEAQLKSYGCSNTERIIYRYEPPTLAERPATPPPAAAPPAPGQPPLRRHPHADRRQQRLAAAAGSRVARAERRAEHTGRASGGVLHEDRHHTSGRDVHRGGAHGRPRVGRGRE